ncbi:MAG: 5-formyltetrahydrofolate cyclo-ligase [Clostridia bacterium]|nr:5-formyltetrahydrofolate cyclo-ligase [Clostridia bacterium]
MNKIELRKKYLGLRRQMPKEELNAKSEQILSALLSLDAIKNAKTVMLYISYNQEVNTHSLINTLKDADKNVCAPVCDTESCEMTAYYIDGFNSLVCGAYGILEPKPENKANEEDIDCVIVPGCVFGKNFARIGYGKGYYDRFLPKAKNAVKIGLCYDFCLVDAVAANRYDEYVDIIVTEKEVLVK